MSDSLEPAATQWDRLYARRGLKALERTDPSPEILWALKNWRYLPHRPFPETAIHIGCGTGRNTVFLTRQGIRTVGIDLSEAAIRLARRRTEREGHRHPPEFMRHDVRDGIPCPDATADLAVNLLAYDEIVEPVKRAHQRAEICRVLRPDGTLLLSVPEACDEFYCSCPRLDDSHGQRTAHDPNSDIAVVVFTLDDLVREMTPMFALCMAWLKQARGSMYGKSYRRSTLVTLWRTARDTVSTQGSSVALPVPSPAAGSTTNPERQSD